MGEDSMSENTLTDAGVEAFEQSLGVPASTPEDTAALSSQGTVLASRNRPADWWSGVREKIEGLLSLNENWDSYGAKPVEPTAVHQALKVALDLSQIVGVDAPTVTATGDGHVGFCWDSGTWSVDASIDPSGLINYVLLDERLPGKERETRTRDLAELAVLVSGWHE